MARTFLNKRMIVSRMQYRLLLGNLLYLFSVVVLFFAALVAPVIMDLFDDSLSAAARDQAARQLLVLHERVWFAVPIIVALCIFHSIIVSHRIAGPLYRFKRIFADMGNGDLTMHVRVRRSDYLSHEADVMTDTIRSLADRISAIGHSYEQASESLPELMEIVGERGDKDAAVLAGKLGTHMDRLGERIRHFQVPVVDDPARDATIQKLGRRNEELSRISF